MVVYYAEMSTLLATRAVLVVNFWLVERFITPIFGSGFLDGKPWGQVPRLAGAHSSCWPVAMAQG